MAQRSIANLRRTNWDVSWNATDLGYVDEVDPSGLKIITEPRAVGTIGKKVPLDHIVLGMEGVVKVMIREVDIAIITLLCPWGDSPSFPLVPAALNGGLYQYAQALVLHPHDMTDTTQDLVLPKTVCISPPPKRDGSKDDEWLVEFMVFPNQADLAATTSTLMYGYVGTAPS